MRIFYTKLRRCLLGLLGLLLIIPFSVYGAKIDTQINQAVKLVGCKYKVSSGFRTIEDNKRVHGAKNSYHLTDRARDIVFKSERCKKLTTASLLAHGLTVIIYSVHLHVDNRSAQRCLVHYKRRRYRKCTLKEMIPEEGL